ncbi:MAG: pyrrolo-quinoline quinone [Planctomycetota bacterium]|nr:MAG: pyrrolo-quinoline quinone [Planctomycetota bacterium]
MRGHTFGFVPLQNALILTFYATVSGLTSASVGVAREWPTFRGPERTAVAPDTDLLEAWPANGPPLVWETAGAGRGYASLAIVGDKLYTLGDGLSTAPDKDEYLTCFYSLTGKQVWKTKTGAAWNDGQESWQSSRSTPTVDGTTVYVLSPFGQLVACATKDGREIFRIDLKTEFAGKKGDGWGYSESVLIDANKLVCTPGGDKATMVALDKKNGKPLWACPMQGDRGAGHSSIVVAELKGRKIYVQTTASGAFAVDAKTGNFLWAYPIDQTTAVIPTPIVRDDLVFFSAGYKRGGALLRQVSGPAGAIHVEEVYGLKKDLANKHGGIVLVGDHLYGDSDDQGIPFCAELLTGNVVWKTRGSGKGSASVMAADGHVYVRFADGTLALIKADPTNYAEVSAFKIPQSEGRPSWSHAVILDGKLYLREQDKIFCYDIQQK